MSSPEDTAPAGVRGGSCPGDDTAPVRTDAGDTDAGDTDGVDTGTDTPDADTDTTGTVEGPAPADRAPIDWDRLPEAVRARLAELAAVAVGAMAAAQVPVPLRRLARFTPAKRAKLGGGALIGELSRSSAFRADVVAWWDEHRPGELAPDTDEPLTAAAAAVLVGDAAAADAVAAAARRGEVGELRAELDAALSRVDKLTIELERLRGELGESRTRERSADTQRDHEYHQLRRRVSEQGAKLRAAMDAQAAAAATRQTAAAELDELRAQLERERGRTTAERLRADRAAAEVAVARQAAREARKADEVRLSLLLDTIGGAVGGLRRELAIGGGGPRPADLVAGAQAGRAGGAVDSLAALDALLSVPSVHLIVDGYNVSKTGYPELPLADQRTRLAGQLAALAARTGIEITVVFDGAGVVTAPTRRRGLRILFSDPGVIADDVIRDLVAAEPQGRPVVVATADRAVVDSVLRCGAHTVSSAVLLGRLVRS